MPKVQSSTLDLDGAQLQNAVLHNITGSGDWSDTIGGIVGFMSANDDKRIAFWDDQLSSLIKVPRLDRTETVTGVYNFSNNFTVGSSTVITNLNADLLDGYNSSTSATQNTIPVYGTGGVLNVATPTAAGHAATKGYVDSAVEGLDIKASCTVATTGSIANLSSVTVATIDGVTLVEGDRVLVKDTASPDGIEALHAKYNGIYVVGVVAAGVAPLTRASDADTDADVTSGMYTFIGEGSTHGNQGWTLTTDDPITLDTTALTFEQFSGAGQITAGNGIDKTGDTLSLKVGGATTWTQGDILYADSTTTINGSGALSGIIQGNGTSAPTGVSGTQYGLPYFATTTTVASTGAGTTTQVLHGSGAGSPTWGAVSLTADVSGTLPVGNGGTGLASWTANGILYASGTTTLANGSALTWNGSTLGVDGDLTFTGPQSITTSSGALTLAPFAGSSLLVNLATTGDFIVNTDDLVVDTSSGNVGIGTTTPTAYSNTTTLAINNATWGGRLDLMFAGVVKTSLSVDTSLNSILVAAQSTTHGYDIQLTAGQSAAGTDLDGGDIVISGGGGTGTGGSAIYFKTATPGTTGTGTNTASTKMTVLGSGNVGIGTTAPASLLDVLTASLGVTQTNTSGLLLSTSTAAAAGAQQISPALRWRGYGWKTDATAASQSVDFRAYILPVEGAAAPTAALVFESSINGAAYAEVARFNSGGAITSATAPNVARIKTFTIGNGADTTLTCTHSFSTRDVQVEVYRVASPYDTIYPDVERVSTSAVDIKFRTAPSSGEYSVVITA